MFRVSSQSVPLGCTPWPMAKILSMNADLFREREPGFAGKILREYNGNTFKISTL